MNDNNFLNDFEQAKFKAFPHRDHIRMAWLYLSSDGWEVGYEKIQSGLKHFAEAIGQVDKYHETITCFWGLVVYHAIHTESEITDFGVFETTFPFLFDKSILYKHYSREHLFSAKARKVWLEPDIRPMPPAVDLEA
jgi:hypothetical protein